MADIVVDYLDDEDDVDTLLLGLKVQLKTCSGNPACTKFIFLLFPHFFNAKVMANPLK